MPRTRKDSQGWTDTEVADATGVEMEMPPGLATVVSDVAAEPAPPDELDLEHFKLGATGLHVKGRPNFDEWANIGGMLRLFEQGVQWLIGDWVCFGEGEWGDKTAQVIDHERWSAETVRAYRWVASKVPMRNRQPGLSFSHHMAVAEMQPSQQAVWLARALKGTDGVAWSVAILKKQIKLKELGPGAPTLTVQYLAEVQCDNASDQAECARQLTNLGRTFTLKTKNETTH